MRECGAFSAQVDRAVTVPSSPCFLALALGMLSPQSCIKISVLLWCVAAPLDPGEDTPLGSGHHAQSAFKVAVAVCVTTLAALLTDGRLIQRGTHLRTDAPNSPLYVIVGKLLRISPHTVELHVKQFRDVVGASVGARGVQSHLADPKTRGPAKKNARLQYPALYECIRDKLEHARTNGYTMTIDKICLHIRETLTAADGSPMDLSYSAMKYYLHRMGFAYGRIKKIIKAGRTKAYVLAWLMVYVAKRIQFEAQHDVSAVHGFLDETFLYRDDTGNFSWFPKDEPGANLWVQGVIPHTRWAIVQLVFCWWERLPDGTHVRRYGHFMETLHVWQCSTGGNMNSDKFLAWLRMVCVFVRQRWPGRTAVFHMDNASYHKKKDPTELNLSRAPLAQLVVWMMQHCPANLGFDEFDFYLDGDGHFLPADQLRQLAKAYGAVPPRLVVNLLAEFHFQVEFTPPYWPELQPMELWNNNLKLDYRMWDTGARVANVGQSVRTFAAAVTAQDVRGWVRHTDAFARAVHGRDPAVLSELVLAMVAQL